MFRPILALMSRTLQMESKMVRTHLARFIYLVLLFFALMISHASSQIFGAPGLRFFQSLTFYNLAAILLAGISFFSSVITEEKEESTIGLLKMAGISPLVLLLGKSSSRLITAILILAVQIPFTLLAITLGGVTLHQIIAAYSALLAFLFMVGNVGLFCSLVAPRSSSASGLMCIFYFFFFWPIPYLLRELVTYMTLSPSATSLFDALFEHWGKTNVFHSVSQIMTTGFSAPTINFQVISNLVVGVLFFLSSWVCFEFFTREEVSSDQPRRWFLLGKRKSRRSRRVWRMPLVWKDFYFAAGGPTFFLLKLFIYGVVFAFCAYSTDSRRQFDFSSLPNVDWEETGAILFATMVVSLPLEFCWAASSLFQREIKDNTFATLFLLPHSVASISYTKMLGYLINTIPAILMLLTGAGLIILTTNSSRMSRFITDGAIHPLFWYSVMSVIFLVHLVAYLSLVIKRGAFVLSMVLFYFVNGCVAAPLFGMVAMQSFESGMSVEKIIGSTLIVACGAGICAAMQVAIGQRLDELATR